MEMNRINPMESALIEAGLIKAKPKGTGTGAGVAWHGESQLSAMLLGEDAPAGDLLREVQAQAVERQAVEDIRLCRKLAQLLRRRMESDGRRSQRHHRTRCGGGGRGGGGAMAQRRAGLASRHQRKNALRGQRGCMARNRRGNVRRYVRQFG